MATTVKSNTQTVASGVEKIFETLSDLRNLEKIKAQLPADKVDNFEVDADSLRISVPPVGAMAVRIKEREPFKSIKFVSEQSMLPFELRINLSPLSEQEATLQLQLDAELPMMVKMMLGSKLQDFVNKFAEQLSRIAY
jgi:carbon monoxide dehydrogenase subunit G